MTQPQGNSGRVLADRYRLDSVLGSGGMGTVWRAEDEMLGRIVAVKELRMHGSVDDDERHRLIVRTLREAKATARIRHAAAVTVFDVVEEDGRPWIVMELVDGRSLAEVVKEDGPVTPARAAEIALELLGVLGAAHSQGILHRDVKPSNVLIGEDGRVVLTDFGIASVEGDASVTSTGMLVGAPSYISPERARGQKPGPPADLWSLGGTLYAMIEGKPPYDRGSALATLTAVMTEDLPAPANAGPLRPVIEGLLERDPEQRLDASTTRSMLKRIVAEATARAESTTGVALPPPAERTALDLPLSARPGGSAKSSAKAAKAAKASKGAKATDPAEAVDPAGAAGAAGAAGVAREVGSADVRRKPGKPGKQGVPGLSRVRVGSKLPAPEPEPEAAPAPAPAPDLDPAQAETGTWTRSGTLGRPARRSRRRLLLAALVLVLLLVAGGVWLAVGGGGTTAKKGAGPLTAVSTAGTSAGGSTAGAVGAASATRPVPPAQSPATSAPSDTGAAPSGSAPSAPAPGGPAPSSAAPGTAAPGGAAAGGAAPSGAAPGAGAAVPAGYYLYTDSSGFTIQLPNGLNLDAGSSKNDSHVLRGDGITLQIDWTTTPDASALVNWQKEEQDVAPTLTDYHRVQLQAVTGWHWSNAADWEWTFGAATPEHSLNRGFVLDNHKYGYAIYWTTNESDWTTPAISQARDIGFQTFQPAP